MNISRHNSRTGTQRGVAAVEAAVIIVAFFVVLLAIMEAGRFLNVHQIVTDATREGARFGVAPFSGTNSLPAVDDIPGVIGVINGWLASGNLPEADPTDTCNSVSANVTTVEICQETVDNIDYTHVTVTMTYQAMIPIFNVLEIPVVGDVRMRNETSLE